MNQPPLNKNELPLIREMLTKYKQGYISGLIPGSNITFSPSGCRNKIVSSTGGGGGGSSALFPNGTKIISSSRDFQSDDAGYILFLDSNVSMTMPIVNPFSIHDNVGIMGADESSSFNIENGGSPIRFAPNEVEGEVVLLTAELLDGNIYLLPISTSIVDDNGIRKTSIKYLYDKVNASGGGGDIFITKTKAEIDALISTNALVKGATYKITGVHPTLYDDGTTSGTTIILKAISENVLETQGTGIFYNPKYNQAVDGFGIWDNKMYGTLTSIVGQFDYINKEGVTANNGATGLMLAQGMIQWVSGDWSVATSIVGNVSGATASISGFVPPAYSVNDKVIWGGYSWTNVNGNVGASVDVLNLDAEWAKDAYDAVNYNIAYDLIEYDYANDMIIRRFEKESNVDVKCSKAQYDFFVDNNGFTYHSISVQQFGNAFNILTYKGQLSIGVNNGYNESINFSGTSQQYLTFGSGAIQSNLAFGSGANQQYLTFRIGAYQGNITFGNSANQQNITLGSNSIQSNLAFGIGANQQYLTFGSSASQQYLTFWSVASQQNLTFGQGSYQTNLTFGSSAGQKNLTFAENTKLNFNNQTINSNMEFVSFRTKAVVVPNLSAATYIYDGNIKEVYQRPDNALKIRYYDNSDVLQIVDIDD